MEVIIMRLRRWLEEKRSNCCFPKVWQEEKKKKPDEQKGQLKGFFQTKKDLWLAEETEARHQ